MIKNIAVMIAFMLAIGVSVPHHGVPDFTASAWAEGHGGGAGKKEGEGAEVKHPDFEYVQLDPILLPVITHKGPTQQLNLLVQLEVPYGKKEEISPFVPRLVDAYLQDLYGALGAGRGGLSKDGVIDAAAIKKRLATVTEKVMGEKYESVKDVLLQVLQQRQL